MAKNKEYFKKRQRERKAYWVKEKGGKCAMCGGVFHPACYDFHHIDSKDKRGIGFQLQALSNERIGYLLRDCILLCANCHRKIHFGY